MGEMFCPECRLRQPASHAFCVRCGRALPAHLLVGGPPKTTRWFPGVAVAPTDLPSSYLRVSCYREDQTFEAPEGSVTIPGRHVRISIWSQDEARCAISIPEAEARALAGYIDGELSRLGDPEHSTR